MNAVQSYLAWQFKRPNLKKGSFSGLMLALSGFVVFQTLFTVMVKATGNIYGPVLALYDTQFMNIVYLGLCLPFWLLSFALRSERVRAFAPSFLNDWALPQRTWRGVAAEQLLILWTSLLDALAAFLQGVGGNGAPADYQNVVSNAAPFVLQLAFYFLFLPRQRDPRWRKMKASLKWTFAFLGGCAMLVAGVLVTVLTPGVDHTSAWCPYACFAVAAVATTLSWQTKEKLFVEYRSNAMHVNTWNAFHMVWMTFPLFQIQLQVPWGGCQTIGTISENFRVGWACMMNTLSFQQQEDFSMAYGCREAAWTEWAYAIATWAAGMAQFPLCRMTSSAVQFAATIVASVAAFFFFTVVPSNNAWVGVGEPFSVQVLIGVIVVLLGALPYYGAERDLEEQLAAAGGDEQLSTWAGLLEGGSESGCSECEDDERNDSSKPLNTEHHVAVSM